MKSVILIRPRGYINVITPPLGIGYLFKALKGIDGLDLIFIDQHRDKIPDDVMLAMIRKEQPLVAGFQIFSADYVNCRRLISHIRKDCPETKTIAGGPHVSGLPEQTLADNPDIDFLVKGEGEEALRLLVLNLMQNSLDREIRDIPNLVYRAQGRIIANATRFIDVNAYGPPAWDILQPDKYPPVQHGIYHKSDRVVPLLTSRGCPYPCTFCAGHLLTGRSIRRRNIADIIDEIEFLQSSYGFKEFIIEDENFAFYKDHVVNFSNEIKNRKINCHFSFPNGIRWDRLDEETVTHLKRMGTYMVNLGIESGSLKTLHAMKKPWDMKMLTERIHLLKKNGMIVNGSFILGFSDENREDIEKTIRFAIGSGIDTVYFGNYIPLPGSDDFNRMIGTGEIDLETIDWNTYTSYLGTTPYHPRSISEKELLRAIKWGNVRFYRRPRIILGLLRRMTHLAFLRNLIWRICSVLFR